MAHKRALLVLCISALLLGPCQAGFYEQFYAQWGGENIHPDDAADSVQISLTSDGMGSTFDSNQTYLFGSLKAEIKLVPGNSAGTVSAFFSSSPVITAADTHDEIDFEFLGNASGQPILLHTNLFANGTGDREEEIYLWFDPTDDFHTYEIIWNHEMVLWFVDQIPIRVYKNIENVVPMSFPTSRPMSVFGCIYNGSTWATEGGGVPLDITAAPFVVTYKNFNFTACAAEGNSVGSCATNYASNWWEMAPYNTFGTEWSNQMSWVRQYYLHYSYCYDTSRNPTPPIECSYNGE